MLLKRFLGNRRGNVAPMFALAIVPIIGFVGAAIDYSRVSSARASMQDALDATALMLSKQAPNLTSDKLTDTAQTYFNSLYHHVGTNNINIAAAYTADGGAQLTVTGSGSLPTTLTQALGFNEMDFRSSSTVKWGSTKLRVALVLDNTGSMLQSNKLPALKTATKQLLTILQGAATNPGDVDVSIVPFSRDVNVGSSNYQQNWFNWATWDNDSKGGKANGTCSVSGHNSQNSCSSAGTCSISGNNTKSQCTSDGVCSKSKYTTKSSCQSNNGTWTKGAWTAATWTPDHSKWNGCVMDRDKDYDVTNTAPDTTTTSTLFIPDPASNCPPSAVQQLGHNWSDLSKAVDDMQANGSTNQTIGLAWGWQTLSHGLPYSVSALPPDTKEIIILLSDGLNTQNRWDGNGSDVSSAVDARMNLVCTNVKAANVTVYTVQVNTGGDPTSTVLKNCATQTDMFYALTTSGQIVTTFQTIGTNLAKLRISK